MPPILGALTGFILGAEYLSPRITAVEITCSGTVHARVDGDASENLVIGRYADVLKNWRRLISGAGLTPREFMEVQYLFAEKVGFLGPTDT